MVKFDADGSSEKIYVIGGTVTDGGEQKTSGDTFSLGMHNKLCL